MSTRRSLAWSFSQQAGQYLLQFVGSVVIARLLTPEEMGVFAIAMAANFLISSLRDFGVGTYLIREQQLDQDKIRTAFGIWIVVSWTLALIIVLARDWLATVYATPGISDVLTLLAVLFVISPFGAPANALLTREMRFDVLHHITLAGTLIGTLCSITLAFLGMSYMALAWGLTAATVARVVMLLIVRPDHLKLLPSLSRWREVLSFGGYVTAATMVGTAGGEGPKFILGGLLSPAAVALFERTVQMPSLIRQGLFTPLARVLLPSFAQDIREGNSIGPAVEKLVAVTTAVIWPAFLFLGLTSVPLIVLLFGENWRVAGEIMPYILLAQAIMSLLPQPEQILLPHGRAKRLFAVRTTTMVYSLAATTIGALHSLELFAMLRPVQAVLTGITFFFAIRPLWQTSLRRLLPIYLKAAAVTAISSLPAVGAALTYGEAIPHYLLIGLALVAPAFWVSALFVTRHPLADEIRLLVQTRFPGKRPRG